MPASISSTQIVQQCPSSDVCYSLSVPDTTASAGSGDIYFQISAPTSYEWVSLGQGSGMAGSNIFVVYTDSTGQNVTVSPRLGTGNVQPQHNTAAQISVLEGSGVSNGVMTANVRCSNCDSWSGGSMDFSSSSASWIYAVKSGSPLGSDQLNANIQQHEQASSFDFDLSAARSSENVNPFVASSGTGTGSGSGTSTDSGSIPSTCTPIADQAGASASASSGANSASPTGANSASPTGTGSSDDYSNWDGTGRPPWADDDGHRGPPPWWNGDDDHNNGPTSKLLRRQSSSACPAGYAPVSASNSDFTGRPSGTMSPTLLLAHAVLACLAFVALFPAGGILIRLAAFRGLVWAHAALQTLAYTLYIVAFGLGVWLAHHGGYLTQTHPVIGIVLFVVLLGQPLSGLLHHRLFGKYRHRTLWSYVHLGVGRVAILLGIVNGGLGLRLAGARGGSVIAYGVVAAVVGLAYLAAIVFGEMKRRRTADASNMKRSAGGRPPGYSSSEELQHFGRGRRSRT